MRSLKNNEVEHMGRIVIANESVKKFLEMLKVKFSTLKTKHPEVKQIFLQHPTFFQLTSLEIFKANKKLKKFYLLFLRSSQTSTPLNSTTTKVCKRIWEKGHKTYQSNSLWILVAILQYQLLSILIVATFKTSQ